MANYNDLIASASKKYGVPEKLIRQVISVESSGDPNANSPTGPRGLMQVSTAVAKESGYSKSEMYDPEKNIDAGTAYLAKNLKAFNGNVSHALLGYNQGTGGAKEMLSGKRPMAEEGQKYMTNKKFSPEYLARDIGEKVVPNYQDYMTPYTNDLIAAGKEGVNPEQGDQYSTSAMFNVPQEDTPQKTPEELEAEKRKQAVSQLTQTAASLFNKPNSYQPQQVDNGASQLLQQRQQTQLDTSNLSSRLPTTQSQVAQAMAGTSNRNTGYQAPALVNVIGGL